MDKDSTQYHVWEAVRKTIQSSPKNVDPEELLQRATSRLLVQVGQDMMDRVAGPHMTFVDPRHHGDKVALIREARKIISLFQENGVGKKRVIVSIPATEAGLSAAQELEDCCGIQTNLTLVSGGLVHALACIKARATVMSIPVGAVLESFERISVDQYKQVTKHPGLEAIQRVISYFHVHDVATKLMATDIRTLSDLRTLGGLDAVSLLRHQMDEVRWSKLPFTVSLHQAPSSGGQDDIFAPLEDRCTETMYVALGKMKIQMEKIEAVISVELTAQLRLEMAGMKMLYQIPNLDADMEFMPEIPDELMSDIPDGISEDVMQYVMDQDVDCF
ncbi:hypothetical protein C8J56DRAFT_914951 [Mycena floridula]|nr:hypothetical protein C8J56DRAFT_914951 [Mycena floridula]